MTFLFSRIWLALSLSLRSLRAAKVLGPARARLGGARAMGALVTVAAALAALLVSRDALAIGTLQIKTPDIQESAAGEWHVKVLIDLPKPPQTFHMPMKFTFAKTVVYERAIMEKGKDPVLNKVTLATAPKQIVELMVDFGDPMGKVHKTTLFEFDLKRSAGFFEAGEYQVTVSNADGDVGTAQKLILKGDNAPVYRGAITFDDKIKKVNKETDGGTTTAKNETPTAAPTSTEVVPMGSAGPMIPQDAYNKTPEEELKERPKGCGCSVPAGASGAGAAAALAFGAALVARRRRR
jgi:MYXO-CTERM domain-containing protein